MSELLQEIGFILIVFWDVYWKPILFFALLIFAIFIILWLVSVFQKKTRMKKKLEKVIFIMSLLILVMGVFILEAAFRPLPADDVIVENVKGAENCYSYVYENDNDIYMNLNEDGVYRYISDDNLELVKDLSGSSLHAMVCTDQYLIYINEEGEPYRLDLATKEETKVLSGEESADKLFAHGNDYFVYLSDGTLWLFEGDDTSGVNITQYMETTCGSAEDNSDISCTYGSYTFYGYTSSDKLRISILKSGEWQIPTGYYEMCCLEEGLVSFHDEEAQIIDIPFLDISQKISNYSYYYQGIPHLIFKEMNSEENVISGLSCLKDDKIYTLTRYAMCEFSGWDSKVSTYSPTKDALVMISPTDRKEEIIYNTTKRNVRIVGMDMERETVYIYKLGYKENSGKVYRVDLKTGKKTLLMDKIDNSDKLHFCWAGDRLFIIGDRYGNYSFVGTVK